MKGLVTTEIESKFNVTYSLEVSASIWSRKMIIFKIPITAQWSGFRNIATNIKNKK